jgi:hypothetical protein
MECAQLPCTIGRTFSIVIALISDSTSIVVMCIFFELSSQHLLRANSAGARLASIAIPLCDTLVHCTRTYTSNNAHMVIEVELTRWKI